MKKKYIFSLLPFAAMALTGCGETKPQCDTAVVTLDQTSITIGVGESIIVGSSISVEGCDVTWSSDHPEIATVDSTGKVTGVSVGTATISANGTTCKVTVSGEKHVTDIRVNSTFVNLKINEEFQIEVEVTPSDVTNKNMTFAITEGEDVISLTETGHVTALKSGKAVVKVTSVDNPEVAKDVTFSVTGEPIKLPDETTDGFTKVKNGEITDGFKIQFISSLENGAYTMGSYLSGKKNIAGQLATIDDEKIKVGSGTGIFIAVKNADGTFSFRDLNNKYLARKNLKEVGVSDTIDEKSSFNVEIIDGFAKIYIGENDDALCLNPNSGNPIFNFYNGKSLESFSKISLFQKDSAAPTPATGVEFNAENYQVAVGYTQEVSAHLLPADADPEEITYSLKDVDPANCMTIANGVISATSEGTAKVVATLTSGLTAEVPVSSVVIPPIIEEGTYTFSHTRDGVTYYMAVNSDPSKTPVATTNADEASILEFVSVTGKKDTFIIKTGEETPLYLNCKNDNNGLSFTEDVSNAKEWVVAPGSQDSGQYDIYTSFGSVNRYIAMFESKFDFRCYVDAKGTNRKENSDLTPFAVKHLTSIEVTTNPTKTEYKQGEEINLDGMVVTAHYENSDDEIVTNYEVSPRILSEAGTITVSVTYKGKITIFQVSVSERKLSSLTVDGEMTKKEYEAGDAYDPTGLTVIGTYDNGDVEEVTAGYTLAYDPEVTTEGQTQVNVTATVGKVTSAPHTITGLTVTKKVVHVDSIKVEGYSTKTVDVGTEFQLTTIVSPEDADNKNVSYTADESGHATVNSDGLVTGVSVGSTTITVTSEDEPTKKATVVINVVEGLPASTSAGFEKIVDIPQLNDSMIVQFYGKDASKGVIGMGNNPTGNNQPGITSSVEEDVIIAGEGVATYKVVINDDSTYSFKTPDGKYLAATGGNSSNYLKEVESIGDTSKFNITEVNGRLMIICAKETTSRNTISLNASGNNPIFSCYEKGNALGNPQVWIYAKEVSVESVELSADTSSIVTGNTLTINAAVLPEDAKDKTLTWTSSDETIATVENGVVTATGAGTATITATAVNGVFDEFDITVTDETIAVTGVSLNKESLDMLTGDDALLEATINPIEATNQTVSWSSDNEAVASVIDGAVTAMDAGVAHITVTTEDGGYTATCTVNVTERTIDVDEVDTLTIDATSLGVKSSYSPGTSADGNYSWNDLTVNSGSIQGNESDAYHSELHNNYAFSREIKYVKLEIAKTSGTGTKAEFRFGNSAMTEDNPILIGKDTSYDLTKTGILILEPIASGSTYFSFKPISNAIYIKSITFGFVDYEQPLAENVTLDKTSLEMAVGDADITLKATVSPVDASLDGAAWSSDDEEVATVENGVVHAVAAGDANISYTLNGHVATCAVTVIENVVPVGGTVVAQYTDTTTSLNMSKTDGAANATNIGLNSRIFTVNAATNTGTSTLCGLNKGGYIALYCNKNSADGGSVEFVIDGSIYQIDSIQINWKQNEQYAKVTDSNGTELIGDEGVYTINGTSFKIQDVANQGAATQVHIKSIVINYSVKA